MKHLLTLIILFTFSSVQAQYLTLDQLVNLQTRDLEYVNLFLVNKGWDFNSAEAETDETMGDAVWAYGKSEVDSERATAWFHLRYSQGYQSSIVYQMNSKTHYTLIKNRVVALGMKLVSSEIIDDGLLSVYIGKNYAVKIVSSAAKEDASAKYLFTILTKESYLNSLD